MKKSKEDYAEEAKQRYIDYLHSDGYYNFADFLNIKKPKFEYIIKNGFKTKVRMVSTKYYNVHGDWFNTQKQAKESYKLALKNYKKSLVNY